MIYCHQRILCIVTLVLTYFTRKMFEGELCIMYYAINQVSTCNEVKSHAYFK